MTDRIAVIALKVALIKEKFSETDILEAVKLMEEQGTSSALLAYLANRNAKTTTSKVTHRKKQPVEEQRSEVLIELENKEPEKYAVLIEFDSLLRQCKILPKLSEIKKLGKQLSKDFSAKNSRADTINKLVSMLVNHPIEKIKEIIQNASSPPANVQVDEYVQHSNFLITGKENENSKSE